MNGLKNIEKNAGMGTGILNLGRDLISSAKGAVPLTMKGVKGTPTFMNKAQHLIGAHAKSNPISSKVLRYGGTGVAAIGADRLLSRKEQPQDR